MCFCVEIRCVYVHNAHGENNFIMQLMCVTLWFKFELQTKSHAVEFFEFYRMCVWFFGWESF